MSARGEPAAAPAPGAGDAARVRRPLFRKYFLALFAAVVIPLLANGASEAWFGYNDDRAMIDQRLRLEAAAAASKIQDYLDGIRDQMQWAVQLPWTEGGDERHRFDALRVLRQVPAIVDLALVDGTGKERLKISRVGRDVIGSGLDRAADPAVAGARSAKVWHGPVRLNRGSEPYMTLAVAGNRAAVGVAIADINLKLIWDVISAIRVGESGAAFVVDRNGRLVAHPNISLVLRGADEETTRRLKALQAATQTPGGGSITARNIEGRTVLMAVAPIAGPQWTVFAQQPAAEAYAPIRAALFRTAGLVLAGAVFAALLAYVLARRMSGPIRVLERGVANIGAGQFDHRIRIATGDELERLAARINEMAKELALSQERSERIGRLKRFLSPQVAELVESAGKEDLLGAQKADVVVVFCDLRGFTAFSAKAEPEEIMRVLGEYYEALGAIIMRYEATLTHFSGDGLMVLLNAPVPCPDDPALRAVRMARDMQEAVQALIRGWHGHALGFGIGLAKGIATVGRIGYEGRHDYTAVGRVANLASRLCSAAEDKQILVDANAAAAVSGEVALEAIGARELKGFGDSLAVYAIARAEAPIAATAAAGE